jgi:molybdopterin molybdotransferase
MPPTVPPLKSAGDNISVAEADRRLAEVAPRYPETEVALRESAGRILREDLVADRPFPPFDRVTMDGIAISFSEWQSGRRTFRLSGIQAAGQPASELPSPESCLEVMTGAVMPRGADCVVPVEQIAVGEGAATVAGDVARGRHIHPAGSDRKAGDVLVRAGIRLSAAEIALAATLGRTTLRVSRWPSVYVISTGDELVAVDAAPAPHQIRRSNPHAIRAALSGIAEVTLNHLPDEPGALRAGLRAALEVADVVIVTGGVSRGRFDFVPEELEALGVAKLFHRVRQRPGRPMWAGRSPRGQLVFGLPGNPVSALVTLHRYVLPMLTPLPELSACLDEMVSTEDVRFVAVRVRCEAGTLRAKPVNVNTSGDLAALTEADGFVQVDEQGGAVCRLWLWAGRAWA